LKTGTLVGALAGLAALVLVALFAAADDDAAQARCRAAGGERWCYTPSHRGPRPGAPGLGAECECRSPGGTRLPVE
jgi:uncharacterized membrane protein